MSFDKNNYETRVGINTYKLDKFIGCLIGGTFGDGLGAPIEIFDEEKIFSTYGEKGITRIDIDGSLKITDDTQMTMYTADALILAKKNNISEIESIRRCYLDWFKTQTTKKYKNIEGYSSLLKYKELLERRGPGSTCLTALAMGGKGSLKQPINYSKGCGGIMRTAPIGLYYKNKSLEDTAILAAEATALTHGHELGYMPSALFAMLIAKIVHQKTFINLESAVRQVLLIAKLLFKKNKNLNYCIELIELALKLAKKEIKDLDAIHKLGEGWVAEETLAIAIYCAVKYENDFEKGVEAAVNHKGDSDSTGSVTGNILGAYIGFSKLDYKLVQTIEFEKLIKILAEKLYLLNFDKPLSFYKS